MTTTKPIESHTVVASSVFLDIVGFSKLPTSSQVHSKDQFNDTLRRCLSEIDSANYWVRDLGDGALIICPHSPEHALFIALNVQYAYSSSSASSNVSDSALRIGLNLGVVKTNPDLEGRANFLGDGINATQRVMDFAKPGQVLASRAFVDAVSHLHADYAGIFVKPQSHQDKHGRTHEVYAVESATETLARFSKELVVKQPVKDSNSSKSNDGPAAVTQPALAPPSELLEHAVGIIRNWFIPFNALLFSAGLVWTGFQHFGFSAQAAILFGVVLICLGVAAWWVNRKKSGKSTAMAGLLAVVGSLVGATGWLSSGVQVTSLAPTPKVTMPSTESSVQTDASKTLHPTNQLAVPAETAKSDSAKPTTVTEHKQGKVKSRPDKTNNIASSQEPANVDRTRCTVLLNKTALGEAITATERQELMQSCR